ncbi:hypothetical protein LTR78_009044 [Recurvomyces mirabilis]|uniref:Uncharacterized protein n=1 Tax=Recurvomyces mirabilis TaxID=574656 RepID=A0AAE0TNZ9_9PEZI|nr:hypothetical protein LTR78_009044 [Recurvomyces mirabilis]KAK5150428.1 hypothetical protein LTS14_010118 [Recurvomyces mirabilis]
MDSPPPVPRKDTPPTARKMDMDYAPASGSKRKRPDQDDTIYELRDGKLEPAGLDSHTPKRSRQSSTEASDTPGNERSLRRKKKVGNLSKVNLRHAAEEQRLSQQVRESKFQEGSLTDRPSAKPPSAFTRMIRTDSGNIKQVDELMEGYNDSEVQPRDVVVGHIPQGTAADALRALQPHADDAVRQESGGFFKFGRSLASNFRPVALWNKMWNETREDLIRQNMEEVERKRKQKEEAEATYAQMKASGQLGLKSVSNLGSRFSESSTMRDSAIVIDSARTSIDHNRGPSHGSSLLAPLKEEAFASNEAPETATKTKGTFRSRFTFRKPSVSNLKEGLKRVKSDFNLAAAAGNRESSSSVSPSKADFDGSTLKHSTSKFDLKKQQKLSKRVSDLESKLSLARRELDDALIEATPNPKLNNKYERFTPQSTLKRPRFIPGKLPSLPSERILMAENYGFGDDEASPRLPTEPSMKLGMSEPMDLYGDETVKVTRMRQYPTRADALFNLTNEKINNITIADKSTTLESEKDTMDLDGPTNQASTAATQTDGTADYAALDAKLKALDSQQKTTRKIKSKKRKSGADEDSKEWKPSKETDESAEWEGTPRKKRKSTGGDNSSPQSKRGRGQQISPKTKKGTNGIAKPASEQAKQNAAEVMEEEEQYSEAESANLEVGEDDDLILPNRNSLDSQGQPLDPVYEEEEETSLIALNGDPKKPTATATPARFARVNGLSRSGSPHKRNETYYRGPEETMITRAAEAAWEHRAANHLAAANGNVNGNDDGALLTPGMSSLSSMEEAVEVDPAKFKVTKTTVRVNVDKKKEDFQWPEDVF